LLLKKNVDVNAQDISGLTPLHIAASRGSDLVSFLIRSGGDPNAQSEYVSFIFVVSLYVFRAGETPLHLAVRSGWESTVEILIKYGANPRIAGDLGDALVVAFHNSCSKSIINTLQLASSHDNSRTRSGTETMNKLAGFFGTSAFIQTESPEKHSSLPHNREVTDIQRAIQSAPNSLPMHVAMGNELNNSPSSPNISPKASSASSPPNERRMTPKLQQFFGTNVREIESRKKEKVKTPKLLLSPQRARVVLDSPTTSKFNQLLGKPTVASSPLSRKSKQKRKINLSRTGLFIFPTSQLEVAVSKIYLNDNQIREIPRPAFAHLLFQHGWSSMVTLLNLAHNELSTVPPEIGLLKSLEKLYVQENRLQEIPYSIGDLVNLEVLDVSNNQISRLPVEMIQLTKLNRLCLTQNPLVFPPMQVCQEASITCIFSYIEENTQLILRHQLLGKDPSSSSLHSSRGSGSGSVSQGSEDLELKRNSVSELKYLPTDPPFRKSSFTQERRWSQL